MTDEEAATNAIWVFSIISLIVLAVIVFAVIFISRIMFKLIRELRRLNSQLEHTHYGVKRQVEVLMDIRDQQRIQWEAMKK